MRRRRLASRPPAARRPAPARGWEPEPPRDEPTLAPRAAHWLERSTARASPQRCRRAPRPSPTPGPPIDVFEGEVLGVRAPPRPRESGLDILGLVVHGEDGRSMRWRSGDIGPLLAPALGAREQVGALDGRALADVAGEGVAVVDIAEVVARAAAPSLPRRCERSARGRRGRCPTTVPRVPLRTPGDSRCAGRRGDPRPPTPGPRR